MIAAVHFSKAFSTRTQYNEQRRLPCTEYSLETSFGYYTYTEYVYYIIRSTEYGDTRY